jgi:sialate O-acetylesterase
MSALALPALFSDHLVLQRGRPVPVWGRASAGERVAVSIAGRVATGVAGADGRFRVELPPLEAGGPHQLVVRGESSGERVLRDVLVGEVWLCSGQSNMEWPMRASGASAAELAGIVHPRIRLFRVPSTSSDTLRDDVNAAWAECDRASVENFSAVAYFFAVELERELGVPIGLVQSAWGGTAAEWWTPIEALEADPELKPIVDRYRAHPKLPKPGTPEHRAVMEEWERQIYHQDPGNKGEGMGWARPDADLAEWKTMRLPQYWETAGLLIDGAVWFRRTIELPAAWRGKDLTLSLGPVDDFDVTYVEGKRVGATGKEVANSYQVPRVYPVPAKLTKGAKLTIAVRVFDHFGNGGICGTPSQMRIGPADGTGEPLPLAGDWLYRVELALKPNAWIPPPATADAHTFPARLWNGMLRPLAPYAIRGAIWYQGESNADRAEQYRPLMKTMIGEWRRAWGYDFPFYQVQLAPFMPRGDEPVESDWAELREAQTRVARELSDCDQAVIIDSGDAGDIHPKNKALCGRRLSRIALARAYGRPIEHSGPRMAAVAVLDGAISVRFSHCDGGLIAHGGIAEGFAVAGEDRVFRWAEAAIDGDQVTLRSAKVPKPVAVRYAWANNPRATLMNQDGLPAQPFRSDEWPGNTSGRR